MHKLTVYPSISLPVLAVTLNTVFGGLRTLRKAYNISVSPFNLMNLTEFYFKLSMNKFQSIVFKISDVNIYLQYLKLLTFLFSLILICIIFITIQSIFVTIIRIMTMGLRTTAVAWNTKTYILYLSHILLHTVFF